MTVTSALLAQLLLTIAVAAALGVVLTPLAGRYGVATGAIDRPAAHRPRHRPVPRTGGVAVAAAFAAAALFAIVAGGSGGAIAETIEPRVIAALLGGAVLAAVLGSLDDRRDVRPRTQFLMQCALGLVAVAAGLRITSIANPFGAGQITFAEPFAALFAALWIVGLINAFNFVDGLDGLSGGIAAIAALTLGAISLSPAIGQPAVALLCAAFLGALLGFLRWNFHPASIFIGTAGVFAVGYTLGVLSIVGTGKVAVALLVLGVPIIDTFWVIVRRVASGRSPFASDRGHLHHRLLDLGISHRGAVLLVYAICAALGALSLVLTGAGQLYAFLGAVVAGGIVLQIVTRRADESVEAVRSATYDPGASDSSGAP